MKLFEYGPFWDRGTFLFFVCIGMLIAFLSWRGAVYNHNKMIQTNKQSNPKWNIYYFLVLFLLWFFYAFKGETVGTDTKNYLYAFDVALKTKIDYSQIKTFHQIEPLFIYFLKGIRFFTESHFCFFAISGFIISYAYVKFIVEFWDEKSEYLFLIPIAVSYFQAMSGVRNALGISFLLLSFCAYKNNKKIKSVLLTLIGSSFHYTIIVNLLVLIYCEIFRKKEKFFKKSVLIPTIFISVIVALSLSSFNLFLSDTKYSYYAEKGGGTLIGNWYVVLGTLIAIYSMYTFQITERKNYINTLAVIFNVVILIIALGSGAYRLVYYYALPRMYNLGYTMPLIYQKEKYGSVLKLLNILFVFVYLLFRFSRFSANHGFIYDLSFF